MVELVVWQLQFYLKHQAVFFSSVSTHVLFRYIRARFLWRNSKFNTIFPRPYLHEWPMSRFHISWEPSLLREEVLASGTWIYQGVESYEAKLIRQTYDYASFDIPLLDELLAPEVDFHYEISDSGNIYFWSFTREDHSSTSRMFSSYFAARDHLSTYAGEFDITWHDPSVPRGLDQRPDQAEVKPNAYAVDNPGERQAVEAVFEARDYEIGRHDRCDVRLVSRFAAQRQCVLRWKESLQSHVLVPLGIEVCLLNGHPVRSGDEQSLRSGDELDFFGQKITYIAPL